MFLKKENYVFFIFEIEERILTSKTLFSLNVPCILFSGKNVRTIIFPCEIQIPSLSQKECIQIQIVTVPLSQSTLYDPILGSMHEIFTPFEQKALFETVKFSLDYCNPIILQRGPTKQACKISTVLKLPCLLSNERIEVSVIETRE